MCYHCVSFQIFFSFTFSFLFREEDVGIYTYQQYEDSSSLIQGDILVTLNHHSTHHQGRKRQQRNLVHIQSVLQQSFSGNVKFNSHFIGSADMWVGLGITYPAAGSLHTLNRADSWTDGPETSFGGTDPSVFSVIIWPVTILFSKISGIDFYRWTSKLNRMFRPHEH